MKSQIFAISVLVVASIDAYLTSPVLNKKPQAETSLAYVSSHIQDLSKVTVVPLRMSPAVATLCAQAPMIVPPHEDKFFDIYVSPPQTSVLETGVGHYPVGCVILKRKYSDSDGKQTELYTGMIKRIAGYNPSAGDWEFFVLSGDGQHVEQSGQIQSCMSCHQGYAVSDYVTRDYFRSPGGYAGK